MKFDYLHRYNLIRLVVPWIAGVFCGDYFFDSQQGILGSMIALCFGAMLTVALHFLQRHSLRWCFGVSLVVFCFMGGWVSMTHLLKQAAHTFAEEETIYRVLLTEKPEQKERSFLCKVKLSEDRGSAIKRQVILYLAQDSLSSQLKGGEELLVSARISPPINNGNFDEFDYSRYLLHQGIGGTGYVASGKWKQLPGSSQCDVGTSYRDVILTHYRNLGFVGDELAVLSALTVGDKTELSESIRESYSVSGASHVLALSGLHIGLLYTFFFFLMKPLAMRGRWGRYLRSFLLLLSLWCFAFFTGLSPSVVRSVCLFSLFALAELFGRKPFSLNTLASAAFLMLLVHPVWLFDVGFQLSFSAVAAILLVQPSLYRLFRVQNRVGQYIWGLMTVSVAAQLGTAPLVILYFSRFSTHFLLTNLVVIPLVTIILYAAILMLLLSPLPLLQAGVVWLVNCLLKIQNGFTQKVELLPYASWDGIWLYRIEVAGLYLLFLLVGYYLLNRRVKRLFACLSCLLLLLVCHLVISWDDCPRRSIVFYNIRSCPVVHCIEDDGHSWLVYADSIPDKKRLHRAASNYWKRCHLQPPIEVTTDCKNERLQLSSQILFFGNRRVCIVDDCYWKYKASMHPLAIHCLYLCKGYKGTVSQMLHSFSFSHVVLDASLSEYWQQTFRNECKSLGIDCHSLAVDGALCLLL